MKLALPLVGLSLLLTSAAAWSAAGSMGQWADNFARTRSGYVPSPSDVAFYYPLPEVVPFTSAFGWRIHPIYGSRRFHSGVDLGAPEGMPVLAAHSGWVRQAGWLSGYGNAITLEYADGKYQTLYAHLSEVLVTEGEAIRPRQVIGRVGSTGGVTGPHLHFELLQKTASDWVAIDPTTQVTSVEAYVAVEPSVDPHAQAPTSPSAAASRPVVPPEEPLPASEPVAVPPTAPPPDAFALNFNPPPSAAIVSP